MAAIFCLQSCIQIAPTWKWLFSRFTFCFDFFLSIPFFVPFPVLLFAFDFPCRWLDLDFARGVETFWMGKRYKTLGRMMLHIWTCTWNEQKKSDGKNVKEREKRTKKLKLYNKFLAIAKHARPDEKNRQNYDEKWFLFSTSFLCTPDSSAQWPRLQDTAIERVSNESALKKVNRQTFVLFYDARGKFLSYGFWLDSLVRCIILDFP